LTLYYYQIWEKLTELIALFSIVKNTTIKGIDMTYINVDDCAIHLFNYFNKLI